jgi:predicted phosphodiesterase
MKFLLNHGSTKSINEYIYPDAKCSQLESCNSNIHDFVLIGHSHYAFSYKCKNSVLINCGSVGQSREKGGVASWALINTENKCFQFISTPYDISKLIEDVREFEDNEGYSEKILLR